MDTNSTDYRIDIYRLGYYGGLGARKVATVSPPRPCLRSNPPCLNDSATGLNDCGNWVESASWPVPADAVSGIYIARLVREDASPGESHMVFIVRDDEGHSPILFQTSDTTWQAYNQYGGNSLYVGGPGTNPGRAYKVSYNRPFTTRGTSDEDWLFNSEYPMVRWLEANGYNVSYFTGVDSDRIGNEILEHQVFLSVGHDEYWSGGQRANVEAARAAGKHLAFFSGNEVFWKTRWEPSIDASATPNRTLVCYKETHAGTKIDPNPAWTGTWRDNRPINPSPNPENALTGTIFTVNCCSYPMTVGSEDGKMRLWRNTSVANLTPGQTATFPNDTVGYEWDEDLDNGARPPGLFRMSSTTVNVPQRILDQGSNYGPGTATHSLTMYRDPSGALVFGAGTVQWMWGLDSNHDRQPVTPILADVRMQQATVNLLADMGVQPGTLQGGLVAATASTDTTAPASQVTSPSAGSTLPRGLRSSSRARRPIPEVSSAASRSRPTAARPGTARPGAPSWSYSWTPGAPGNAVIRSRAVDDSGNIETPSAGVSVTVGAPRLPVLDLERLVHACQTPIRERSRRPSRSASSSDRTSHGFVTGIRFYKGPQNTGTHVGAPVDDRRNPPRNRDLHRRDRHPAGSRRPSPRRSRSPRTRPTSRRTTPRRPVRRQRQLLRTAAFDNAPLHALADGVGRAERRLHVRRGGVPDEHVQQDQLLGRRRLRRPRPGPTRRLPPVVSVAPLHGAPARRAHGERDGDLQRADGRRDDHVLDLRAARRRERPGPGGGHLRCRRRSRRPSIRPLHSPSRRDLHGDVSSGGADGVKDARGQRARGGLHLVVHDRRRRRLLRRTRGPAGRSSSSPAANPFGRYYAEILRAEGLNAFDVKGISAVTRHRPRGLRRGDPRRAAARRAAQVDDVHELGQRRAAT